MDYIRQSLKDDYNYVCAQYSPEKVCDHYSISEDDVLRAHYLISDYFLEEGEEIMFGIKIMIYYHPQYIVKQQVSGI